jgi:hypothetical protein
MIVGVQHPPGCNLHIIDDDLNLKLDIFRIRIVVRVSARWTAVRTRSLHDTALAMAAAPVAKRPLSPSSRAPSPPPLKRKVDSTTTSKL